jgi:hypothetical protein
MPPVSVAMEPHLLHECNYADQRLREDPIATAKALRRGVTRRPAYRTGHRGESRRLGGRSLEAHQVARFDEDLPSDRQGRILAADHLIRRRSHYLEILTRVGVSQVQRRARMQQVSE